MSSSTDTIELEIQQRHGIRPGPYLRGVHPTPNYPTDSAGILADWLVSLGVDAIKATAMSPSGRQNAYNAGREWVRRNLSEDKPFVPGRQFKRHRGVGQMDLTEGFAPNEVIGLLGGTDTPAPTPVGDEMPTSEALIDAIARTADPLIAKRLTDAEQRLQRASAAVIKSEVERQVRPQVIAEVEKLKIAVLEETKAKISEIATQAAQAETERLINERIPRRLEIISPRGRKILDAEPRHEAFDRIFFWLALKRHVYIVGPHGTGKTHLFKQLAQALDLTYFPIGQTLTKYELSGHKGPTGEYIGTLLREAIETGGFVGIDEGDTWAAAAMVFLNTPLANGYCSFPDKVVQVHPDFVCAIAANTWGHGATMQYQGRNPLDAASLDRFAFEEVDYDENLEIQLYGNTAWTQYCHRVRKVARELRIYEAAPSMRGIEMGNLALDAGGDADLVQKSVLWKGLAPDTVAKIKTQAGTFGKVNIREVA
jgi:energy-coupling factor transporter ATP-binding protein EcfA2